MCGNFGGVRGSKIGCEIKVIEKAYCGTKFFGKELKIEGCGTILLHLSSFNEVRINYHLEELKNVGFVD